MLPRQMRNRPTVTVSTLKYWTVPKSVSVSIATTAAPAAIAGRSNGSTTRRVASACEAPSVRATSCAHGRLVAQRGASHQVHVRIERERQREDRERHRPDLGEPRVAAELVAPPRLDRAGDAEHRQW